MLSNERGDMNKIREILQQVREYITAAPNAEYTGENILALLDRIEEQLEEPLEEQLPADMVLIQEEKIKLLTTALIAVCCHHCSLVPGSYRCLNEKSCVHHGVFIPAAFDMPRPCCNKAHFEERVEATAKEWPAWKRNALGPSPYDAGVKRR